MSRNVSYAVFFALALTVVGAVHFYLWARLVRDPAWPAPWYGLLTGLAVALFVSVPATSWLDAALAPDRMKLVTAAGHTWMGLVLLLLVVLGSFDLGRLVVTVVQTLGGDADPAEPERRLTLARMFGGAATLIAGTAGAVALRSGLAPVAVKEVRVGLARLPEALSGTTIVQISDLHVGSATIGKEFVERIVATINDLRPDVIAITGDLVDGSVAQLRDHVEPLTRLVAKHGAYFVTGNHEYYSGVESWCRELDRLGVRVLRNERVSIGDEHASFDLAGIEDPTGRRRGTGPDLRAALAGRDERRELVLLAHQPRAVREAEAHGVGLQLSGHTHGGQMFPWNFLVRLQQPVVSGLERIGRTLVYVSNGTGYWGPPMRLGAPAEITKIVLERAAA